MIRERLLLLCLCIDYNGVQLLTLSLLNGSTILTTRSRMFSQSWSALRLSILYFPSSSSFVFIFSCWSEASNNFEKYSIFTVAKFGKTCGCSVENRCGRIRRERQTGKKLNQANDCSSAEKEKRRQTTVPPCSLPGFRKARQSIRALRETIAHVSHVALNSSMLLTTVHIFFHSEPKTFENSGCLLFFPPSPELWLLPNVPLMLLLNIDILNQEKC